MEDELRPTDFVDYQVVFSGALILVGKGLAVSEALESCLRESYPLTYREMVVEARSMLARLKREREWGSLRALRELADRPGLADMMRRERTDAEGYQGSPGGKHPEAIADYPRIFALAQRKRKSGFSLDDSLEMAVRELYPQTYRKVLEAARFYVSLAARKRGEHEMRALRELAEDPFLFSRLEDSLPE
ncbi:MAG: hypothetical protein PHP28_00800 [Actinomycetota bacterium]|nr:hypothetical protein [Actinomycetota bacterium]MDD5668278.1 hypothetical protein [Actinomycetota bacterium]